MKNVKKALSVVLSVIMMFVVLFQNGTIASASIAVSLPYVQDFESTNWTSKFAEGSPIGTTVGLGANNPEEWKSQNYVNNYIWPYAKLVDEEHGVSMQLSSNGGAAKSLQMYLQFSNFAQLTQDYLVYEFDARADSYKLAKKYEIRNQSNTTKTLIELATDSNIKVDGKNTGKTYKPNQWYHFKVILNQKDDKYVVYLDGERLNVLGALPSWTSIQYLFFTLVAQQNNGTATYEDAMYFDNVRLSTLTPDAFTVVSTVPDDGSQNVSVKSDMLVTFNNDLQPGALTSSNVLVNNESGHVAGVEGVLGNFKQIKINFNKPLAANTLHEISFVNVIDIYGQLLPDITYSFTTGESDGTLPAEAASPYLQVPYYYNFEKWTDGVTFGDDDLIGDGIPRAGLLANNVDNWKFQNYNLAGGAWAYKSKVDTEHGVSMEIHSKGQLAIAPTVYVGDGAGVNMNNPYIVIEFDARAKNMTMKKDYQIRGWGTVASNFEVALSFDKASDPSALSAPILVDGQDTGATYEPNRWYQVKILLNHVNRTYVTYLDGVRLSKTGTINDGVDKWSKLAMMYFSLRSTDLQVDDNNLDTTLYDGMYLDNLRIREGISTELAIDNSVLSPIDGATNVAVNTTMTVGINNELSAKLPTPSNILVNNEPQWVSSIEYDANKPKQFVIHFVEPLDPNYTFTVTLTGIKDIYDQVLPDTSYTFTTGDGVVVPYVVGAPTFMKYDPNAEVGLQETVISKLQAGLVKNQIRVRNINSTNTNVTVAIALFEGNALKEVQFKQTEIPQHTTAFIAVDPVTVSDTVLDTSKVKVMVWQGFNFMQPMRTATVLDTQGIQ